MFGCLMLEKPCAMAFRTSGRFFVLLLPAKKESMLGLVWDRLEL